MHGVKNNTNNVDEIYKKITNILGGIVSNSDHKDYIKIKATKGVATVPYAPWISARDVRLADKQSEGYSLVYLYSVDLKKVHLSIAFGTGQFLEVFSPKKEAYSKMRKAASRIQKVFENDLNIEGSICSCLIAKETPSPKVIFSFSCCSLSIFSSSILK